MIQTLESGYRAQRSLPLVRLADLRLRQGRLEEAERLLEDHEWHPAAQARAGDAIALATRRPRAGRGPRSPVPRARRLRPPPPAHRCSSCSSRSSSRAAITTRRRETLERLTALAGDSRGRAHAAPRPRSRPGGCSRREGDERASSHLQAALERFSALEPPARGGSGAARACRGGRRRRRPTRRLAEARLALRTFERLGAAGDADRGGRPAARAGRRRPRLAQALRRADQAGDRGSVRSSQRELPTRRSPPASTSARGPPSTTSQASCRSWGSGAAPRRPRTPARDERPVAE